MGDIELNTTTTPENEDTFMTDDLLDDELWDVVNDTEFDCEEEIKKKGYGQISYCKYECEFYNKCLSNTDVCIKSVFARVFDTLTPREGHVIRSLYGIECECKKSVDDVGKDFNITRKRIIQIRDKALRKLRHPSRARMLNSPDMCLILISSGKTNYFDLWERVFGKAPSREELYISFLEQSFDKKQKELEKIQQQIDAVKWQKKKTESQLNITDDTTITECYFGNKYDGGTIECETPVGELRNWNGQEIFKLCNYNKELFEEVVSVLLSHNISFVDFPSEGKTQTYIEKVYATYSAKLRKDAINLTIEELGFSVRTFNLLKRAGIDTVEDLILRTEDEMFKIRNMSKKCLEEIKIKLGSFELCLLGSEILTYNCYGSVKSKTIEMTIEELDFSVSTFNCLKRAMIDTVDDLVSRTETDIKKIRNLGKINFVEIVRKLESIGLSLSDYNKAVVESPSESMRNEVLDFTISDLRLSNSTWLCLRNANILTVRDLICHSEKELIETKCIKSKGTLDEIIRRLDMLGVSLAEEEE